MYTQVDTPRREVETMSHPEHVDHESAYVAPGKSDSLETHAQDLIYRGHSLEQCGHFLQALAPLMEEQSTRNQFRKHSQVSIESKIPWQALQPHNLKELYQQARNSSVQGDKAQYLQQFNHTIAPLLTWEEAAMEQLAVRHAYLNLEVGMEFNFAIEKDFMGGDVTDYANRYVVADIIFDKKEGLVGYLLTPESYHEKSEQGQHMYHDNDSKRSIIVFRGTSPRGSMDASANSLGAPTGVRPDIDPSGIGKKAVRNNEDEMRRLLAKAGPKITIVGHSLGGALATRAFAKLGKDRQLEKSDGIHFNNKLITFGAPAIDKHSIRQISSGTSVLRTKNSGDFVTMAGKQHPPGEVLKIRSDVTSSSKTVSQRLLAHTTTSLVDAQLMKKSINWELSRDDKGKLNKPLVEGCRKVFGRMLYRLM